MRRRGLPCGWRSACLGATLVVVGASSALAGGIPFVIGSDHHGAEHGFVYRSATYAQGTGGALYAVATCPAGKRPIGGGGDLTGNAGEAWMIGSAPDFLNDADVPTTPATAWTTGGWNGTSTPVDLTGYAICHKPRPFSFARHRRGTTTVGEPFAVRARCPGETRLVGGGFFSQGNADKVLASTPFDGHDRDQRPDDGWRARVVASQSDRRVTVRVACSRRFDLAYRSASDSTGPPLAAVAECPQDATLTAGGASISQSTDGSIHTFTPVDFGDADSVPADAWQVDADATGPATLAATAICVR